MYQFGHNQIGKRFRRIKKERAAPFFADCVQLVRPRRAGVAHQVVLSQVTTVR